MISPRPHIARMSPYALAELTAPEGKSLISLSQNESLRPPSPNALDAASDALQGSALYPDPNWLDLRNALADLHGISADGILCGNGSLDLIACLTRAYAGPGRAILAPVHAYPFFRTAAQIADARFDTAKEINAIVSVDALLAAVKQDTTIVFVANPGNPTGTRIPNTELVRLREGLSDDVILVIDEAYGEFADHLGERTFDMVSAGNTIVMRTFSKAYGMAGFRLGWGLFPLQITLEMRKLLNPNNLAIAGQAAAVASLADQPYMRETCALTADLRDMTADELSGMGLRVHPSFTNFLLIEFDDVDTARRADAALRSEGIFLRGQAGAGLPQCLRMTIGPNEALNKVVAVLQRLQREGDI